MVRGHTYRVKPYEGICIVVFDPFTVTSESTKKKVVSRHTFFFHATRLILVYEDFN